MGKWWPHIQTMAIGLVGSVTEYIGQTIYRLHAAPIQMDIIWPQSMVLRQYSKDDYSKDTLFLVPRFQLYTIPRGLYSKWDIIPRSHQSKGTLVQGVHRSKETFPLKRFQGWNFFPAGYLLELVLSHISTRNMRIFLNLFMSTPDGRSTIQSKKILHT